MILYGPGQHPFDGDAIVLSVLAPCFNEEANVEALVERTLAVFDTLGTSAELLLVDDGSTDCTWDEIARASESDRRVRGVRHESNQGIEGAWRSGLKAAAGELVCLIDADLQNRPEDIPTLYEMYLRQLPDLVQGIRHPVVGARARHLFSRGLNFLLNLTFRTRLRDSKSGFILARRAVLESLLAHRFSYRYFQSFIGAATATRGLTIAEVDTDFDQRHGGTSFLNRFPLGVSLRILWELLKYRVETLHTAESEDTAVNNRSRPLTPGLAEAVPSEL